MASLRPVEVYGLEVPAGEGQIPIVSPNGYPCTFRLTMAAIDPTAEPLPRDGVNGNVSFTGATLKIIRVPNDEDDEDEDFDVAKLLGAPDSDEEDSELDEDINGGPSDPEKSPKARRKAALQKLRDDILEDMNVDDDEVNGAQAKASLKAKGKAKAVDIDDLMSEDELEEDLNEPEEFVLCTLDTHKTYQQPLDITINDHETVWFSATGTHSVYLTGNILIPDDASSNDFGDSDEEDEEDSGEYDLSPDEDELELPDDEDESDELDDMSDPRIEELGESDDGEAVPTLVNGVGKAKNKNKKRPADDSDDDVEMGTSLDDLISQSKADTADKKLSKAQLKKQNKKIKNNEGHAIEATTTVITNGKGGKETVEIVKQSPGKSDKKVQFAKTLVQGPTSSSSPTPGVRKDDSKASKATESALKTNGTAKGKANDKPANGVRNVSGVSVDDRKVGSGPAAKKGDKVSMRYIGKLEKDKRVFDSNKKGTPFSFKLGAGQVIKGWDLGVAGMAVGGERRITVPPHLAYGSKALPDIPANSTLVFDLKLLEIK